MRRKLICLILLILILGLVGCNNIHIGGHDYGPWQVVEEATCTEDGLQERICSCGEKETEVLPALDHEIVVDEARAATCTKDGATEGSHCSRCKLVIQQQEVIPAGHVEESISGMTPTCTRAGKEEGFVCSVCGEIVLRQKKIRHEGHDYVNGVCTKCNKVQPDMAAAIVIDQINEKGLPSFYTKRPYPAGSTVTFQVFVPEGASWWAVSWTRNAADAGVYKWSKGDGVRMNVEAGQWQYCTVTLPDDGGKYYIYFVGAKGEWGGKALLIDDVTITAPDGEVLGTDRFTTDVADGLFYAVKSNSTSGKAVVISQEVCAGHWSKTDEAVEATCDTEGKTEGAHCGNCGKILKLQEEIPAAGHKWDGESCSVCGKDKENLTAAILIDQLNESAPMNFITKQAYAGGTTLIFRAFVPEDVSWWAVNWTTDPANVGLYKAAAGLGQYITSQKGQWADYAVTLPNDGNSYYFYIVGAKGEWNEEELLIDDVILVDSYGKPVAEDSFDNGMHSGIFKITEKDANNRVVVSETVEVDCLHSNKKQDSGVAPDCTNAGVLGALTCKNCGIVLHGEIPLPAVGHQWANGECSVCHEQQIAENHVAAIYIDNLTEETASFITKDAYAGGSKVEFNAYVPAGTGWWAVCWTTDPANVGLYKWTAGLGQSMTSQKDQWADYSVTLPDDGNSYYVYIVGAKGEWGGKTLMIDNVTIGSVTEDFENGLDESIFNIIKSHGANTIAQWKIAEIYTPSGPCENGHTEVIDPAVAPGCTETGLTEGSHCSVCGEVIVEQTVVEAAGHQWANGECSVCHKPEDKPDNHVVALYIDNLTEETASFITKGTYAGGTKVSFQAYVPSGTSWWAVCWTTDPANVGLYKWTSGLGQSMSAQKDQWAEYSVTLPNDGNSYYIYIVGAKGEWGGKALLIDNVTIGSAAEDFENGFENSLFTVVEKHGANTIVEWKIAEIDGNDDPCKNGHTEVIDPAVEPTCTETGLTAGSHCSVCGTVIVEQTVVEATGHQWANGECSVCHELQPAEENHIAAIYIDKLTETAPMSFITKDAYAGGSTVSFQAYVPTGASWWAVCWTTDPANVSLYKWTTGSGKTMTSQKDQWAEYSVTLPDDGNSYYVYIVGAKGEWGGKALLIDDFSIGSATENFENGFNESLFNVVEKHGSNTIVELQTVLEDESQEPAGSYATAIYIDNLTEETASFITKDAYAGGSTVSFEAFVPSGASWWAVCWTTDPGNVGLYKWTSGSGKSMSSQKDQWADYSVTLPDDGKSYYVYIVGAKGEWGGKALLIDDVTIGTATEDFENGFDQSLFNVVEKHGANTIVEIKRKDDSEDQ